MTDEKQCPFCAETIKFNAKVCRFCNRELPLTSMAVTAATNQSKQPTNGWSYVGALAFIGLAWWFGGTFLSGFFSGNSGTDANSPPATQATSPAEPAPPTGPQLKVLKWSWHTETGYCFVEGQVKNISGKPMENVEALVTFTDKKDGFVTSADSLIDFNPILPGQTSTFTVMKTNNPAIAHASVEFKYLSGGSIESVEK